MSLKFKGGYELEFAIDSENEFKALRVLANVFGENIKREIKFPEVAKRDELVFITHRFTKDELSDDNYKKLLKNEKTLLIIKDGEPEVIILEHPLSVAKWLIYAPISNPLLCTSLSFQQRSKQAEPINYTP